jgi:hypothetical protein
MKLYLNIISEGKKSFIFIKFDPVSTTNFFTPTTTHQILKNHPFFANFSQHSTIQAKFKNQSFFKKNPRSFLQIALDKIALDMKNAE